MKFAKQDEKLQLKQRLSRGLRFSRISLYTIALPFFMLAVFDNPVVESFLRYVYMIIGFSVIIFVHELGHFLVARACNVNCPVFSVGMGHRLCGWKKGIGFTFGPQPDGDDEKDKKNKKSDAEFDEVFKADDQPKPAGKTDYRISMLPIGGYVRMLGQDDMDPTKISTDPNSYNSKPIWQRMCIISAGVIMNIIFAIVIFAVVFKVGIDRPGPVIGSVQYGSPADKAGMHIGDRIVATDDETPSPNRDFMDVMIASALSNGRTISYSWEQYPSGTMQTKEVTPEFNEGIGLLMIGVSPLPSTKLPIWNVDDLKEVRQEFPELANAHNGDVISQFNEVPLASSETDYIQVYNMLQATNGDPVKIILHNNDPKIIDRQVTIQPKIRVRDGVKEDDYPTIAGFTPRVAVQTVFIDSPAAKAGLKAGDAIVRVNETENPTILGFIDTVSANAHNKVSLIVERNGTRQPLTVTPENTAAGGKIQMAPIWDMAHPIIASVATDDPALKNIIPGSQIVKVNGQEVSNWHQILAIVRAASKAVPPATEKKPAATAPASALIFSIQAPAPNGSTVAAVDVAVPLQERYRNDALNKFEYVLGIQTETATELQKSDTLAGAVAMGLDGTRKFVLQTYFTLYGLFNRTIPVNQLHGALGIAKVGHDIQEKGFIHLLFLLGVISVNLAVANFLPLPIVDGGHFLLLIVEKIRGRRLAPKIELTIQYVGLCLIIGMLLFVTYNDIGLFTGRK